MSLNEVSIKIPGEYIPNVFGQFDAFAKKIERTLHAEQHYSKHIFPVHKVHRSKCSAYQQIYRGIVKSSPDTLDC